MKAKLLVVDDSVMMRKIILEAFKSYPIELVGEASNGEEALEIFSAKEPNVVTMDLTMPKLDGFACIEEIRKRSKNVKILAISALANKGAGLKALKLGANDFILKPVSLDKMGRFLKRIYENDSIVR